MQTMTKRLVRWAITVACFLLIPLALTIRDGNVPNVGWNWSPFDFVFMFILLFGAGFIYEFATRNLKGIHRIAAALAVVTAVVLVWVNAAVGIIGDDDGFNLLYFAVLLIGLVSALLVRFKPHKMFYVMFATAVLLALVPVVALMISNPQTWGSPGILGVFLLNSFFVLLFVSSALLFRRRTV